jgi:DNA-binding transcriptional LysR family regulator
MDFDLRLVRYFVVVADELHFGRAAVKLYISQPALSKQIRKLEDFVGEPLLVRDSRHVRLTLRGQRFLEDARQLLTIAERMSHPQDLNVVRIAHVFELTTSREVADAFAVANPNVQVVERSMDSIRQLDALLSDWLDIARCSPTPPAPGCTTPTGTT